MDPVDDLAPAEGRGAGRGRRWAGFLVAISLGLIVGGCAIWAWPETAVVLESTPSGAEVSIDGRPTGQTPLRLTSRPWPLQGEIEVRQDGFRAWSGALATGPGETRRLEISLEPLPGTLFFSSTPPGATVSLDGQEVGQSPIRIADVAPGQHELRLTLGEYEPWEASLEIAPGASVEREITLRPQPTPAPPIVVAEALAEPAPAAGEASLEQLGLSPDQQAVPTPEPSPKHPIAIMIENAPDARPQSGLGEADLVFEAMAEGGISRFMAVYIDHEASVVGPVRSARHYFVNLAAELGASVVHIGASPLGYVSLSWYGLRSIDETFGQPGFWRSPGRAAPHNAYTGLALARQALDGRAPPPNGGWGGFSFKEADQRYSGPPAPQVSLEYDPWGYVVEYRYNDQTGRYGRFMEGAPHRDAESKAQLEATNVAVLRVNAWVIDSTGRLDMAQVGSGPAAYFVDGTVVEGSWSKPTTSAPTQFLDGAGNAVRFNPGPTWVQLISAEGKVSY